MNARSYRVNLSHSPLDFQAKTGLVESSVAYQSEPKLANNKVELSITKYYVLVDMNTNKQHVVLAVRSVYEIPPSEIKTEKMCMNFIKMLP
jgi:ribosomal protein L23